jgi:hypothetical protein
MVKYGFFVLCGKKMNWDILWIEYCRLNIEYLRSASGGSILKQPIKKSTERHAAQAPALRERLPQIFNLQSSIFN